MGLLKYLIIYTTQRIQSHAGILLAMATIQRHITLAYIEHAITGTLDSQAQSKATNRYFRHKDDTPSTGILAQKR